MPRRNNRNQNIKRKWARKLARKLRKPKPSRNIMVATRSSQGPIAPRLLTKLKYTSTFSLSLTSTLNSQKQFNLNSLYSPEVSGGHQPYGYDQISPLYARYRVYKTAYRFQIMQQSDVITRVAVIPHNSSDSWTSITFDALTEKPRAFHKMLGYTGSGTSVQTIKGHISLPRLNGQTSAEYRGNDRAQSLCNTSPAEDLYLSFIANSAGSPTINVQVQMIFYVEFFDPNILGQS